MRSFFILLLQTGIAFTGCFAATAAACQDTGPGLRVDYYDGTNFDRKIHSRIEAQVDYQYAHQTWLPGLDELNFSARWTGRLYAPVDGVYKFILKVDDGIRLWLGGKLLINEWHGQSVIHYTRNVRMKAGHYYALKIEYFNHHGPGAMKLWWELPEENSGPESRPRTTIPAKYLSGPTPPPARKPPVVAKTAPPVPASPPKPAPVKAEVAAVKREPPPVKARPAPERKSSPPPPAPEPAPALGNKAEEPFDEPEPGKANVLPVRFEQSQYLLLPESYAELDKLASILLQYPRLRIRIAGHTDNVGDPRLNQALSENRAIVVANYLVRQGVAEDRIRAEGYGGSRPVAGNATETERSLNRRVEFMVESYD